MVKTNVYVVMSAVFLSVIIMGGILIYAPNPQLVDSKIRTPGSLLGATASSIATSDTSPVLISELPGQSSTMTITGSGTVSVSPDQAVIILGVYTEGKSANSAMMDNAILTSKVIEALKGYVFQTVGYTVNPVYNWDAQMVTGYQVTNTLSVTLTDLTKVGIVIDLASGAGANRVDSVTFSLSDAKFNEIKMQAYEKAIADVKEKARVLSEGFGVANSRVQSISEGYYSAPVYRNSYVGTDSKAQTPIISGTLDITVSLNVVYAIG